MSHSLKKTYLSPNETNPIKQGSVVRQILENINNRMHDDFVQVNMYVDAAGNDANDGLSATQVAPGNGPFLTLQAAIDAALAYDFGQGHVQINLGAGTFSGAGIAGPFRGGNVGGTDAFGGILIINGNGGAGGGSPTHITAITTGALAGGPYSLVITDFAIVLLQNIDVVAGSSKDGVSLINFAYCIINGISVTGTDIGSDCLAAEGFSFYELAAAQALDIYGTCGHVFSLGSCGHALLDPVLVSIRIFGAVNIFAHLDGNSNLHWEGSGTIAIQGGGSTTGSAYLVQGMSNMAVTSGTNKIFPSVWGKIGICADNGRTRGFAASPTTGAVTGLGGAGAGVTVDPTSDSHCGFFNLTPGATAATSGSFVLNFNEIVFNNTGNAGGQYCGYVATAQNGSGSWNAPSIWISADSPTTAVRPVTFSWKNATALTSALTYTINYAAIG